MKKKQGRTLDKFTACDKCGKRATDLAEVGESCTWVDQDTKLCNECTKAPKRNAATKR